MSQLVLCQKNWDEYFLTQFADQKAHDEGGFLTPVSLVETIMNVIELEHGRVLDPP